MKLTSLAPIAILGLSAAGCGSDGASPPGVDASADLAMIDASDVALSPDVVVDAGSLPTDGPAAAAADARLAAGLAVQSVAVFQSVKVTLMQSGVEPMPRNAPIVAGRSAVVRVYVSPSPGWTARPVLAELVLTRDGAAPTVLRDTRTVQRLSRDDDPSSVFAFNVAATDVTEDVTLRVQLLTTDGSPVAEGASSEARYPTDGSTAALGAQSDFGGLNVVLVPFRYDTDGSGRLPDTSPTQLARIRALLTAMYPITAVSLDVRPPIPWNRPLTSAGNVDFPAMNEVVARQRSTDRAPTEAYYYGLVSPANTRGAYCGASCTTGQSFVVRSPANGGMRVGAGVGFTGDSTAQTLAHEIGHQHGRMHAPCGTTNPDGEFPYRNGSTGVWGYDPRGRTFLSPLRTSDFMSYCEPEWISDYTFAALFERVRAVRSLAERTREAPETLRFVHIEGDAARWGDTLTLAPPIDEAQRAVRWLDARGVPLQRIAVASFARGDDGGETLLVPEAPRGATTLVIERAAGGALRLAR